MARPRTIQLEQGEISLLNFPKETADALVEHIKNFGKPLITVPSGTEITSELKDKAIGVRVDSHTRRAQMVTVAYNAETMEAKVEKIQDADGMRDAIVKFKMKACDLNFV